MTTIIILFALHFVGDFGVTNDAVYRGRINQIPDIPWSWWLTGHAALHGIFVGAVLGFSFGLAEFVAHWVTDALKPLMLSRKAGFYIDQAVHLASKIVWWYVATN